VNRYCLLMPWVRSVGAVAFVGKPPRLRKVVSIATIYLNLCSQRLKRQSPIKSSPRTPRDTYLASGILVPVPSLISLRLFDLIIPDNCNIRGVLSLSTERWFVLGDIKPTKRGDMENRSSEQTTFSEERQSGNETFGRNEYMSLLTRCRKH